MAFIADKKETCLSWRTGIDGRKFAYFRKRVDGKDKWQSLGELALEDAREMVRNLRRHHALGLLNQKLGLIARADTSTFADLFAAYDSYCVGIDIREKTVRDNKTALMRIVRTVRGEGFDVENARISVFDVQLLRDYSAAVIRARKTECAGLPEEESKRKIDTAQRTIKSTVQQARSLFARDALQSTACAKLSLPDMTAVMRLALGASTLKAYEPPPVDVVNRIAAEAAKLKDENPGLWLAFNLEVNAGLRRGSAVMARWDWFTVLEADAAGKPLTVDLRVGVAKGGESVVRFDAGLYAEMLDLKNKNKAGDVYVIPGNDGEDRDGVFSALVQWLKDRGLKRRQPNHELRKLYGDRKYSEHGAEEAQRALGHSDPKLTSKVYAAARSRKSLRVI